MTPQEKETARQYKAQEFWWRNYRMAEGIYAARYAQDAYQGMEAIAYTQR